MKLSEYDNLKLNRYNFKYQKIDKLPSFMMHHIKTNINDEFKFNQILKKGSYIMLEVWYGKDTVQEYERTYHIELQGVFDELERYK